MKIGIRDIIEYIPKNKINNLDSKRKFDLKNKFIRDKIGFLKLSRILKNQTTIDLALNSAKKLINKYPFLKKEVNALILVTQNPHKNIPHNSAIIHNELNLSEKCSVFDISLGCSGWVHGLSIAKSFMESNNLKNGILITADPYSKILNYNDKETSMIFGDASTSTFLSNKNIKFEIKNFDFGTKSSDWGALKIDKRKKLYMNGRKIFNFAFKNVPMSIKNILKKEKTDIKDIDFFVLHQGSKFILNSISKSLEIKKNKLLFLSSNYGNTVSSSIPIILSRNKFKKTKKIICSGFGVGLSWATVLLKS